MNFETGKLKKRLEIMNQELAKKKRKLKKHSRKKLKLAKDALKFVENETQDGMIEEMSSFAKAVNTNTDLNNIDSSVNLSMFPSYCSNLTVTDELNEMTNLSLTDCPQDVCFSPITNTESISCYDKCLTVSQLSIQDESLQGISIAEEASIQLGQVSVAEPLQNSPNTSEKIFSKDNISLSPILMKRSVSKSQDKRLQKKRKPLSSKLQRKDFVSSEISDSVKNTFDQDFSLHMDTLQSNTSSTVICTKDDTVPAIENIHSKIEETANNSTIGFESHTVDLPKEKGQILAAFCRSNYFISVQENEINFWYLSGMQESVHFHIGTLSRENIGTSLGCKGNIVKVGSEDMLVCMELWMTEINTLSEELTTTLTGVVYCYNITKKNLKSYSLPLKHIPRLVKNVQMCVLPEMSVIVSWITRDTENYTSITKFSLDNNSQLVLKFTELSSVEGVINSLHCIKGCWAVVLGENDSHIILWEHCTGVLVKTICCPRNEAILQCVEEDQGFLFIAVSTRMHVKFIVMNLTTSKWKQLQQFEIPDSYKLMGVGVDKGRLVAVLLEGILCWDLKSGLLLAETHIRQENISAFVGEKYAAHISTDFTVNFVCISSLETVIHSSLIT